MRLVSVTVVLALGAGCAIITDKELDQRIDADGDGEPAVQFGGFDCDDSDPKIGPLAEEIWYDDIDQNCDGADDFDADGDGERSDQHGGTDCDDADANTITETWYGDCDGDGFPGDPVDSCGKPDGACSWTRDQPDEPDCNDNVRKIKPDAIEVCNALDDDCDGRIDDDDNDVDPMTESSWFADGDGDGFGTGTAIRACDPGAGWVIDDGDCDDADDTSFPGGPETFYDGIDGDCDGANDYDADGDGFVALGYELFAGGTAPKDGDCDDLNVAFHPEATDTPYDGFDNDCSGTNDYDGDGDGHVAIGWESEAGGTAPNTGDCNDADDGIHPSIAETWYDDVDQNCDGLNDYDQDMDGYVRQQNPGKAGGSAPNTGDCDDTDEVIVPNATIDVPGDFATIQAAVDVLCPNGLSTINVAAGTYLERVDLGVNNVDLIGAGSGSTILDATGTGLAALSIDDSTTSVTGFTITGAVSTFLGGGVAISGGDVMFDDVSIDGNEAPGGGGMQIGAGANVTLNDTLVTNNTASADDGGGIAMVGTDTGSPNVSLTGTNVVIDGNTGQDGGGLYARLATVSLTDTVVSANNGIEGAGIKIEADDVLGRSTFTFTRLDVTDNVATNAGGGLHLREAGGSFEDVRIIGNSAPFGGAGLTSRDLDSVFVMGLHALDNTGSTVLTFEPDLLASFLADDIVVRGSDSNGLELRGEGLQSVNNVLVTDVATAALSVDGPVAGSITVRSATLVRAGLSGVAITSIATNVTLDGLVVVDTDIGLFNQISFSNPTFDNSIVWSTSTADWANITPGLNVLTADPLLQTWSPTLPGDRIDARLAAGSPAIDMGDMNVTDPDLTRVDMGYWSYANPPFDDYDDTDVDGMWDGWELDHGLIVGSDDSGDDLDGDNLTNLAEFLAGTWPSEADTDGDGVDDDVDAMPLEL